MKGRLLVAAALLATLPAAGCSRPAPNVLLVTIDTLRADHLGTYGFPFETSPSIDRLARSGVVFERAIAGSSTTGPSHASIMTSRHTREHTIGWVTGHTKLVGGTTLAEAFRAAGFATAGFVGNVNLRRRTGFARGFEVYDDALRSAERNRPLQYERIAEHTTGLALAWLGRERRRPFFLWVHYQDPHGPYAPPPGHEGRFQLPPEPEEQPLPVLDDNDGLRGIPKYQALDGVFLPSAYRGRYADEIHYADRFVGELIEAVTADPSGRETVVLLTADHGESLGEHDFYFVHNLISTPALAHVPLLLRAPGLAPERRREPVGHVDVMPTLMELAGLEPPAGSRGLALGPYLREGRPLPDRLVYCDAGAELSAYRGDGFVRVVRLMDAWERPGEELSPVWGAYRWPVGGPWEQLADREAELERIERDGEEISGYFEQAVPLAPSPLWDPEERERLRALGYAD